MESPPWAFLNPFPLLQHPFLNTTQRIMQKIRFYSSLTRPTLKHKTCYFIVKCIIVNEQSRISLRGYMYLHAAVSIILLWVLWVYLILLNIVRKIYFSGNSIETSGFNQERIFPIVLCVTFRLHSSICYFRKGIRVRVNLSKIYKSHQKKKILPSLKTTTLTQQLLQLHNSFCVLELA